MGNEATEELSVVVDGVRLLLIADKAVLGEFNHQRALVEFFIESGFEGVENFYGGTDDDLCELVVVSQHGGRYLTTDGTDGHGWRGPGWGGYGDCGIR
jgi:hypothetical protein